MQVLKLCWEFSLNYDSREKPVRARRILDCDQLNKFGIGAMSRSRCNSLGNYLLLRRLASAFPLSLA